MSRRRESFLRLEALGGLSECYSAVASVRPDVIDGEDWEVASDVSEESTKVVIFDKPPPPGRRFLSVGGNVDVSSSATSAKTAISEPPTSLLHQHAEPASDVPARRLHRVHAEQNLSQAFRDSEERSLEASNLRLSQQYVTSISPKSRATSPVKRAGERCGREASESSPNTRIPSGSNWAPQKPAYVQSSSDWETQSEDSGRSSPLPVVSRYLAYKPVQQGPEENSRGRSRSSRSSPLDPYRTLSSNRGSEDDELRSDRSGTMYSFPPRADADSRTRRDAHASRISESSGRNSERRDDHSEHKHRRAPLTHESSHQPRSSSFEPSPTTAATINPPPPPKREPSPSRGSWTADRPRQTQPSFAERARERLEAGVHLRLQKAGKRPLSSFGVRRVVKCPPSPVLGTEGMEGTGEGLPFAMRWRNEKERRKKEMGMGQDLGRRDGKTRSRRKQTDAGLARNDSLFLGNASVRNPATDSFFAPEWSQREVKYVMELASSSSSASAAADGRVGERRGGSQIAAVAVAAAASSAVGNDNNSFSDESGLDVAPRPSGDEDEDDREALPSRRRRWRRGGSADGYAGPVFTSRIYESPSPIQRRGALSRRRGRRSLRG
ncbi:hypothetical protein AAE478_001184 [Parahypoxylon ruwenzoriense]